MEATLENKLEAIPQDEIADYKKKIRDLVSKKIEETIPLASTESLVVIDFQNGQNKSGIKMSVLSDESTLATLDHRSAQIFATEIRNETELVSSFTNKGQNLKIMTIQTAKNETPYEYSEGFSVIIIDETHKTQYAIHFSDDSRLLTIDNGFSDLIPVRSEREALDAVIDILDSVSIPEVKSKETVIRDYMATHKPEVILKSLNL